ncbi:MAG: phosphopyruvate hydratase [Candidatus Moraniibacteriota bacterium]
MRIKNIIAKEILDSRGNPTVETEVVLENGIKAKASVPSGASTGSREALELRDEESERYSGKGVRKVCKKVEEKIFPAIEDISVFEQEKIDQKMLEIDGTDNKSSLGANAILSVSLSACRAAAKAKNIPLWSYIRETYSLPANENYNFPVPMMNVVNGGEHADSGLDIQEFMLVPSGLPTFQKRIRAGSEIYHKLKKIFEENDYRVAVGDEGGFAPGLESNEEALQYISKAIGELYGLEKISTGIDAAASEFYDKKNEVYNLRLDGVSLDSKNLQAMYSEWIDKFNLEVIEDPMSEFDWKGWTEFNEENKDKASIIGDDLLVTNKNLIEEAIERKACNAVLIKVNQIGSLTETIESIKLAKNNKMKIAVSHRSGETTDDFIADLAVATEAEYVKFGAPARGERVCKYNRILEIEEKEYEKH